MIASDNTGWTGSLPYYMTNLYRSFAYKDYGKTVGMQYRNNLQVLKTNYSDLQGFMDIHIQCQLYQGDPGISLYDPAKPDYVIEAQGISSIPANVTTALDTFQLKGNLYDLGKSLRDSVLVRLQHTMAGSTTILYADSVWVKDLLNTDTITFNVPLNATTDIGQNNYTIKIDANDRFDELSEDNNQAIFQLFIYSESLIPLYPKEFAIVHDQGVTLKASTLNAFAPLRNYRVDRAPRRGVDRVRRRHADGARRSRRRSTARRTRRRSAGGQRSRRPGRSASDLDAASRTPDRLEELPQAGSPRAGSGRRSLARRAHREAASGVGEGPARRGRHRPGVEPRLAGRLPVHQGARRAGARSRSGATLRSRSFGRRSSSRPLAEPRPGWIRGFRMAEPIIISYARGLLKEFPGIPEGIVDVIPVDLVVAAIIAVAANGPSPEGPSVYQVASGSRNPLRYGTLVDHVQGWFTERPIYDSEGPTDRRARVVVPRAGPGAAPAESRREDAEPRRSRAARASAPRQPGRVRGEARGTSGNRCGERSSTSSSTATTPRPRRSTRSTASSSCGAASPEADRGLFCFDPATIDWAQYITEVHLPSVVDHARVKMTPGKKTGPTRRERGRKAILSPDRHLAAFDLENTIIASQVVDSYSWIATRHLDVGDRVRFVAKTLREAPGLWAMDRRDRGDFLRHFYRRYEDAPVGPPAGRHLGAVGPAPHDEGVSRRPAPASVSTASSVTGRFSSRARSTFSSSPSLLCSTTSCRPGWRESRADASPASWSRRRARARPGRSPSASSASGGTQSRGVRRLRRLGERPADARGRRPSGGRQRRGEAGGDRPQAGLAHRGLEAGRGVAEAAATDRSAADGRHAR